MLESKKNKNNITDEFLKLAGTWADAQTANKIINDIYNSRTKSKRFNNTIFN